MIDIDQLSEEDIRQYIAESFVHEQEESLITAFLADAARPAAVLVPLLRAPKTKEGYVGWHILLTKRSNRLAEHSGQVAFPGGGSEPQDSTPEATALREAKEEIGLQPLDVKIIGKLDSLLTITNYQVYPIIGIIPWPYQFHLANDEVERIFTIPLTWLLDSSHYEIRHRVIPPPFSLHFGNDSHPIIYYQPYKGEVLWGVSAEITMRLLKILCK